MSQSLIVPLIVSRSFKNDNQTNKQKNPPRIQSILAQGQEKASSRPDLASGPSDNLLEMQILRPL